MRDDFTILPHGASYDGILPFALIQATHSRDLKHLLWLLDDSTSIGSIGGDPGWSIDRRKPIIDASEYATWPAWAEYCVQQCDPCVTFEVPLEYVAKERFETCLRRVLAAREIAIAPIEDVWQQNLSLAEDVAVAKEKYDHPVVRKLLFQEPFQPFRLVLKNGDAYEIRDRQKVLLSRTEILVAAGPATGNTAADLVKCPFVDITSVDLIGSDLGSRDG